MLRLALLFASGAALVFVVGSATASFGGSRDTQLTSQTRFICYPAQFSGFKPRSLRLVDQFYGRLSLSVDLPDTVCSPAPGTTKGSGYLTCYRTRLVSTTPSSRTFPSGSDEFGSIKSLRVNAKGLTSLCVPSSRADVAGSSATGLDFFTCYPSVRTLLGSRTVSFRDDFGEAADTVTYRTGECATTAKLGFRIFDRRRYLSCYSIKSPVRGTAVLMRDEFGLLKAALGVRARLCAAVTPRP